MRNSARQHCSAPSSQSFAPPFLLFQNRCVANRLVAKIVAQSAIPQNVAPMYARQNDIQKHHAKSRSQKKQEGQLTPLQPNKQPNNQPTQTPLQSKSKSKNKNTHTQKHKRKEEQKEPIKSICKVCSESNPCLNQSGTLGETHTSIKKEKIARWP